MKKFLVSLLVAGLVMFSSVALASQGDPGWYEQKNNPSVTQYFKNGYNGNGFVWMETQPTTTPPTSTADVFSNASGTAYGFDGSFSSTWGWGNWNDYSMSGAIGWVSGLNESTASADGEHCELQFSWRWPFFEFVSEPNEATANSYLFGHSPDVNAWSFAMDFGTTSIAGAGAEIEGDKCDILVGGSGFGLEGGPETSYTEVGIGGSIWQSNHAGETGYYSGTFAEGGNQSGASFAAYNSTYDDGQSWNLFGFIPMNGASTHLHGIEGNAVVEGCTYVSVDPYGPDRSAYATTHNSAIINFPGADYVNGVVYGSGGVGAAAVNGGTFAGGSAGFSYNGYSSGSGQATVDANIHTGFGGSSISVVSSATAVAE